MSVAASSIFSGERGKLIFIGKPIEMDDEWLRKKIEELDLDSQEDDENIKNYVHEVVPTYKIGMY